MHNHSKIEFMLLSCQLLDSLWIILKGNINLAFNLVTMILSLVVFSGTYVLNAGLSMVSFGTYEIDV